MKLVVYVTNLLNITRPSDASDASIIEGLTKDNFLVAVVDYGGTHFRDPLQFQKDINLLWYIFSGGQAGENGSGLPHDNRSELLEVNGPIWRDNHFILNFSLPGSSKQIAINKAAIYVIPSGYTVEARVVIEKGNASNPIGKTWPRGGQTKNIPNATNVTELFVDIVYPAAGVTQNVPLLLAGSTSAALSDKCCLPNPWYPFIGTHFDITLFSWLFNGYAFANMNYVHMDPYGGRYVLDTTFTQAHTVRYLRSHKDYFSLSGYIGT